LASPLPSPYEGEGPGGRSSRERATGVQAQSEEERGVWSPALSFGEPEETRPVPAPPQEVQLRWDERLITLWNARLSVAIQAAGELYAVDSEDLLPLEDVADDLSTQFWRLLSSQQTSLPPSAPARYYAVVRAVWQVLQEVRQGLATPELPAKLAVALRPVRKLRPGILTAEVCAALYYYHRGVWTPYLTKPELWIIRTALAKTIAALPPDEMDAFWENLQSSDTLIRDAMRLGLTFLRSAHAVPHLLRGLERIPDNATRAAIVDCLEEIADPRALAPLIRLRQETAQYDWPLSRQIARAIRIIEQQNRDNGHRTLLRPSATPADDEEALLRPVTAAPDTRQAAEADRAQLLRPASEEDEKT